jgi:8-amino-7-oxononanoate synthase
MRDFSAELEQLKDKGRYRSLRLPGGIDLSSNDYLGLSGHSDLRSAAIEALENGTEIGATGSRLLRGHRDAHAELETFAAQHFGVPKTLFFANGFQANYALITTLIGRHDVAIFDALCHASMRDGLHASHCDTIKVRHNDPNAFEAALKKPRRAGAQAWVLVESVYSMDGDVAPVAELLKLCEQYDAMLIVDEAHGTGVFGATGRGVTEGLSHERMISLHTCGKALGVAGALVCARADIVDYLVNAARPFIFSTAPMPLQALLVQKALQLAAAESWRRDKLQTLQSFVAGRLQSLAVHSPIVPIIIGDDARAVMMAEALQAQGFDIRAIRPPTVPAGTARLRLSLNANLSEDALSAFANALSPLLEELR